MLDFKGFLKIQESLGDGTESFIDELPRGSFSVVNTPGEFEGIPEFSDRVAFNKATVYFSCRIMPTKKGIDSLYFNVNRVELDAEIKPIDDLENPFEKTFDFKDIRVDSQNIEIGKSPYFIEDIIIDMKNSSDPNFFQYRVRIGQN